MAHSGSTDRVALRLQVGLLVALAAGVYLSSLTVPFIEWDDGYYVVDSIKTHERGWEGFLNVWSLRNLLDRRGIEFFPLRDTVYWVLFGAFGPNPVPFHVVSVMMHALCVVLMFSLALRIGVARQVAFWGAALFAAHPVHVESVTWVSGLKDPMCTALIMGALHCYLSYRKAQRPVQYALFLGLMVGSLWVKSLGLVTPLLAALLERFCSPTTRWRLIAVRLAGPVAITALFWGLYVTLGRYLGVIVGPHGGTWWSHAFLAGWAMVRYVQQAFVPATFSLVYCFRPPALLDWRLPLLVGLPIGVTASVWLSLRRERRVAALVGWFFICLLPVSNLVPFPAVMADRYLYASTMASCLGTALLVMRVPGRTKSALLGAIVAVFGLVTLARGVVWHDESSLWAEVVSNPECRQDPETANVWLKYFDLQSDAAAAVTVFREVVEHPGFDRYPSQFKCSYLVRAAEKAHEFGNRSLAQTYASEAGRLCPLWLDPWETLLGAAWGQNPGLAAEAARRVYRLSPTLTNELLYNLARVAAGDSSGVREVARIVAQDPAQSCPRLGAWLQINKALALPGLRNLGALCAHSGR